MNVAHRDLVEAVKKLYEEEKCTDATLICQGFRKPVHSAVLIARCVDVSPYENDYPYTNHKIHRDHLSIFSAPGGARIALFHCCVTFVLPQVPIL